MFQSFPSFPFIILLQFAMAANLPPASSFPPKHSQNEIEIESRSTFGIGTTSASSSTAADHKNQSSDYYYQVFINHRGPDVKKTFASHLYRRLLLHGYRVFLDQPELERGDDFNLQIESAIRTASVHVAIFSHGYAQSKWCLDELLLMLESGAPIIPVFYYVKPNELRWTRREGGGVYARALNELEKKKTHDSQTGVEKPRYDPSTIEKWRNALSRVADISGFELDACEGDEGVLVDQVVEGVLKKLKKTRFHVAKYPTGLDEKVKEFENTVLLNQQSGKPQVVGIVGLGGIGKTTLVEELFNRKSTNYRKSYLLPEVRAQTLLPSLQRKLLKGLTQLDVEIEIVSEGIEKLKERLSSSQALVIFDDVDSVNQLDALLPIQTVLSSDSLILITSRDKDVLRRSGVKDSSIYKLTGLNIQHARELFCCHAFSQRDPLPGFESLVNKFLEACDGLPLSLKVFGALLYGQNDTSYWEYILQKMIPSEIQERLKISYETLDREEKQIFLDITCFFIGEDKDMAIRVWEGSGRQGLWGFKNIENKCLVEVNSKNKIKMHDHLRDLGREIAETSSPRRLWRATENIDDLLEQSFVINEVRGLRALPKTNNDDIDEEMSWYQTNDEMPWYQRSQELFENFVMKLRSRLHNTFYRSIGMREFELLVTEGRHLKRILKRVQSPNFIWLRWYKCPYSSLLSWIPIRNISVLQVQGRMLKTLWQAESQVPLQLRELQIFAPLLSIPKSIGQLKHLERIVLKHVNLKKLPEEFCELQSLKFLALRECSEMKSLPVAFGNLANLQHIDLSDCDNLEKLPISFGNLIRLKYLNFSGCCNLAIQTLGNITSLEFIDLYSREKIKVLLPQVAHQRALQELDLRGTNLKELPGAIGNLGDLEVLKLRSPLLEALPDSLGGLRNLKELTLENCKALKSLPASVRLLTQLTELRVSNCLLGELPFEEVNGEGETLSTLSNLDSSIDQCLPRLQYLRIINTKISKVSFAGGVCPNLQNLFIIDCNDLVEVGTLPNSLIQLHLLTCDNLRKIEGFCCLTKLQKLLIQECEELEEMPNVETLVSLEYLWAYGCVTVKSIRGLAQLTKLRLLDVHECLKLEELEGVEHCMSLETLNASGCPSLQWGEGVEEQLRHRLKMFQFCQRSII